jgi:hypothetical protein
MNAETTFEALVLSRDVSAFRVVNLCLRELSIVTNICFSADKAAGELKPNRTDLVLLDFDTHECSALLRQIWRCGTGKRPTIVALSRTATHIPGAHFVLQKPMTHAPAITSFRAIYRYMLLNYRQHARCSVMLPADIIDENLSVRKLIVTDIGQGGMGLMTREEIAVGSILKLKLELPETPRCMRVEARVLWKRAYSRLGCDFHRISTIDAIMLQEWIRNRCGVKKPLIEV